MKEKKNCEQLWRAALTANQLISGKIAKMALFNPCMKFEFWRGQMTSFEVFKRIVLSELYS